MTTTPPSQTAVDLFSRNLGRGKACDLCRRRKLRCDGVRPVCSRCSEARIRRLNRMRQKGASEEKLNAVIFPPCFVEKGQANDSSLGETSFLSRQSDDEAGPSSKQRRTDRSIKGDESQNDLYFAQILSSQLPVNTASASTSRSLDESVLLRYAQDQYKNPFEASEVLSAFVHTDPLALLPSTETTRQLIETFLEIYQLYSLFQPKRFLERFDKGPHDEDFPHASGECVVILTLDRIELTDRVIQLSI